MRRQQPKPPPGTRLRLLERHPACLPPYFGGLPVMPAPVSWGPAPSMGVDWLQGHNPPSLAQHPAGRLPVPVLWGSISIWGEVGDGGKARAGTSIVHGRPVPACPRTLGAIWGSSAVFIWGERRVEIFSNLKSKITNPQFLLPLSPSPFSLITILPTNLITFSSAPCPFSP